MTTGVKWEQKRLPLLTFGSLFSGIGGIDLGLERAGMAPRWQCEIDPYCRRVLAKHWPDIPCYDDVRSLPDDIEPVDLICGGYPCQPFSLAGSRAGRDDPRHLWPAFAGAIRNIGPRWVLLENVPGHLSLGFGEVLGDLAALGYDAEWTCIPAAAVGAPHLRWRVFVVAHASSARRRQDPGSAHGHEGQDAGRTNVADAGRQSTWPVPESGVEDAPIGGETIRHVGGCSCRGRGPWDVEPDVGRVAHGVPNRVDRLRALGNAVVPQVAELVGSLILEAEEEGD